MRSVKEAFFVVASWSAAAVAMAGTAAGRPPDHPPSHPPQGENWKSIARLPDWSGVWAFYLAGGGQAAAEDANGKDGGRVPLTPEYRQKRAAAAAAHAQENLSKCLPAGTPGVLQHRILFEYLFSPGRVTMLFEDGEVRRIYTDGRPHRSLKELTASFMGDSIGHWDGNTLVVDTIGFPNGTLWQNYGILATRNSHLVERMVRKDKDHMEIQNVLTDPAIFTKAYTYTRLYEVSTLPIYEAQCAQANRDTGTSVDLTPPPAEQ
jgi:hypothetical protein